MNYRTVPKLFRRKKAQHSLVPGINQRCVSLLLFTMSSLLATALPFPRASAAYKHPRNNQALNTQSFFRSGYKKNSNKRNTHKCDDNLQTKQKRGTRGNDNSSWGARTFVLGRKKGSTVPECLLDALDVILAKVALSNFLFADWNTIPCLT